MDNYEWQKNYAVVQRMYYSQQILCTTTFFALSFTAVNLFYVKKNYFAAAAKSRILPTWKLFAAINLVTIPLLLRPLTRDEMEI